MKAGMVARTLFKNHGLGAADLHFRLFAGVIAQPFAQFRCSDSRHDFAVPCRLHCTGKHCDAEW